MRQYEQILSKISPVFFKFINYKLYFRDNYKLVSSYLEEIDPDFISDYPYPEIPIVKAPTYLLLVYIYIIIVPKLPTINLFEDYRTYEKGRSYDASYDEAIVILIINNFSFEEHSLNYSYYYRKYRHVTLKDLFIALVGKDTYDTIRRNIK